LNFVVRPMSWRWWLALVLGLSAALLFATEEIRWQPSAQPGEDVLHHEIYDAVVDDQNFSVTFKGVFSEHECKELLRLAGPLQAEALVGEQHGTGLLRDNVRLAQIYSVRGMYPSEQMRFGTMARCK